MRRIESVGRGESPQDAKKTRKHAKAAEPSSQCGPIDVGGAIEEKRGYFAASALAGFTLTITEEYTWWQEVARADRVLRKFLNNGKYQKIAIEQVRRGIKDFAPRVVKSSLIMGVLSIDFILLEKYRIEFKGCNYSPLIETFLRFCFDRKWGALGDERNCRTLEHLQAYVDRVNEDLVRLRGVLSERSVVRKDRNWSQAIQRNIRSAREYVKALSNKSNLQVIRLTLGYRTWDPQVSMNLQGKLSSLCQETLRADKDQWLRRAKRIYGEKWAGHIWRVEYCLQHGYCFHVHVFLRARRHSDDVVYGVELGELWVNGINQGQGEFLCFNQFKALIPKSGLGYLSRGRDDKLKQLWKSIGCGLILDSMVKRDLTSGGRNFGHGSLDEEKFKSSLVKHLESMPAIVLRNDIKMTKKRACRR